MSFRNSAIVVAAGVAIVATVGIIISLAGCGGSDYDPETTDLLIIYTAHTEEVEQEFARAFADFYRQRTGREILIRWPRTMGSGSIRDELRTKHARGIHDVDIVFGGGPIHADLKNAGLLAPYKLPDELLEKIPAQLFGEPLYDPDYSWYGAALSTFGIIVNERLIADRKLPQVRDWQDIACPELLGLVGAANPSQSGAIRKMYEIILQSYGYEQGMRLLALQAANAPSISQSGGDIPRGVASAQLAAGPAIDYLARRQMGNDETSSPLRFVVPAGRTVFNADPISILNGAPNRKQAELFVEFVMSPAGQQLWSLKAGAEGGPQKAALRRQSVLPEIYTERAGDLAVDQNPFTDWAGNDFFDSGKEELRIDIMPQYLQSMMVVNHSALASAWKAIIAAGMPEELVAELTAPLISEDEMLELARGKWQNSLEQSNLKKQWNTDFRTRYRQIEAKARRR